MVSGGNIGVEGEGEGRIPRIRRAAYKAPLLVVLSIIAVATAFRRAAAQRPCLRPNLALRGPTRREERKVPTVMREEMSCWTVG